MKLVQLVALCALIAAVVSTECEGGEYLADNGTCAGCSEGYYSMKWDRYEDKCYVCPVGSYADHKNSTWCSECDYWMTTKGVGSTNESDCNISVPDIMSKVYKMRISLKVTIDGSLCGMSPAMWNIEGVSPYDFRATSCKQHKDAAGKVWSSMGFEIETITEYGIGLYHILSSVQVHRSYANAVIGHYGPKIKEMLWQLNDHISDYGIKFDVDRLNLNATIAEFYVSAEKICAEGYHWDEGMQRCDSYHNHNMHRAGSSVFHASINSEVCAMNGGKAVVQLIAECKEGGAHIFGLPCLASKNCTVNYLDCWQSGNSSVLALSITGSESQRWAFGNSTFNQTAIQQHVAKYWGAEAAESTQMVNLGFRGNGCSKGYGLVQTGSNGLKVACRKCKAGSYAHPTKMTCELCPFNTYTDSAGQVACTSCGYGHETPLWGMNSSKWCLETDTWWNRNKSDDYSWAPDYSGQNELDIDVKFELNECGMAQGKRDMDNACSANEGSLGAIEKMICQYSPQFKAAYEHVCMGDRKAMAAKARVARAVVTSFQDTLTKFGQFEKDAAQSAGVEDHQGHKSGEHSVGNHNGSDHNDYDDDEDDDSWLLGLACAALKPMYVMDGQDLNNDCANISREDQVFSIEQAADFGLDMETSQWLVPMLDALQGLVTAGTWSASTIPKTIFSRIGIEDLDFNGFLNMKLATTIVKMLVHIPEGVSFPKVDFSAKTDFDSFMCSGNGTNSTAGFKRECYGDCWRSQHDGSCDFGTQKDLYCKMDECNSCKETWYHSNGEQFNCKGDSNDDKNETLSCDWPKYIDHGYLNRSKNGSAPGEGKAEYKCYSGYRFINNNNKANYHGHVLCRNGSIGVLPTCYKKNCTWPDIDNGYLANDSGSSWKKYACNDGFEFKNSSMSGWVKCEDGEIGDVPVCVESKNETLTCDWPKYISSGYLDRSWNKSEGNGYARYRCRDGYEFNNTNTYNYADCINGTIGALPKCQMKAEEKNCTWPGIENGYLSYNGTQKNSKWSKYACYSGYQLNNSSNNGWVKCDSTTGETADVPECVLKPLSCDWPSISYGYLSNYTNGSTAGEGKAEYKCYTGYQFNNTFGGHVECTNGTIGALPKCYKKQCNWPEFENGYLAYSGSSWKKYACNSGFEFKNSSMSGWVQCKDGEVGDVPVCQRKALTCNWPSRITYGYLNSSVNGSIAGEGKAEYKCYSGYKFNSTYAGHVECTNGTIGALPRCYKKQCNWPHIEDGYLSYNGTQRGSTWSKYACYSGFEFRNSPRSGWVKCNDGEIEDQDVPTCQRKPLTCNWPTRISYGYLNSSYNGSTAGEGKAEYKCYSGYEFNSTYAGHVECTNGTIGALPTCYKKQCNWPEIEDGYVKYNSSSWIKYACDYGFEFKNSSREWVRCTDGEIGPLPECQLYCDWPRYIKSGRLNQTYNTSAPGYAKAQYVCYSGYQFNSTSENGWVKCSNGTIPALPSCSEMKCEWPEKIENGYLNNSKTTEAGSGWAKYNCNDNFEFKNSTESNNGYVKCSYGEIGDLPVCEKKSETKIKVSMKLKGKKANKNKFICQMTVKIDGKSVTPDLSLSTAGGIIGYETEDSNNGTELDISKNWKKTSDKPLGMEGWYKPGKKGQQYDCFQLWTVYDGIKATTDKVCWKEEKSVTTIKASLKLKGKKAKKNKFICKLTVKIDGKRVTPEKSLSTAGGIIGFKTVDSKDGTELDIGKNWKQTSDDPLGMNTWYKPGKKGQQYDCFQLWTVYDGIKATTDKVCWN